MMWWNSTDSYQIVEENWTDSIRNTRCSWHSRRTIVFICRLQSHCPPGVSVCVCYCRKSRQTNHVLCVCVCVCVCARAHEHLICVLARIYEICFYYYFVTFFFLYCNRFRMSEERDGKKTISRSIARKFPYHVSYRRGNDLQFFWNIDNNAFRVFIFRSPDTRKAH